MIKWEYIRQLISGNNIVEVTDHLNALGNNGWELVHYENRPSDVHGYYRTENIFVVMKRPLAEPQVL